MIAMQAEPDPVVAMPVETYFQLLWFVMLGVTLWGMLTHHAAIPPWVHQNDKAVHFVVFGALAGIAHGAWPWVPLPTLWGLLTGLGLLAEGAQHFTARHRFCWRDALANALGAASVLALLHWVLG